MGRHLFGMREYGERYRFYTEFSDEEFEELVFGKLAGELPKDVFAWHLEDGEDIDNSERVRAIAQLPIACGPIGNWLEAEPHLIKLRDQQLQIAQMEARLSAEGKIKCSECGSWHRPGDKHLNFFQSWPTTKTDRFK